MITREEALHLAAAMRESERRRKSEGLPYVDVKTDAEINADYDELERGMQRPPEPCQDCGTIDTVTFGPDPFREDVHKDGTDVWMCKSCREKSARDI